MTAPRRSGAFSRIERNRLPRPTLLAHASVEPHGRAREYGGGQRGRAAGCSARSDASVAFQEPIEQSARSVDNGRRLVGPGRGHAIRPSSRRAPTCRKSLREDLGERGGRTGHRGGGGDPLALSSFTRRTQRPVVARCRRYGRRPRLGIQEQSGRHRGLVRKLRVARPCRGHPNTQSRSENLRRTRVSKVETEILLRHRAKPLTCKAKRSPNGRTAPCNARPRPTPPGAKGRKRPPLTPA